MGKALKNHPGESLLFDSPKNPPAPREAVAPKPRPERRSENPLIRDAVWMAVANHEDFYHLGNRCFVVKLATGQWQWKVTAFGGGRSRRLRANRRRGQGRRREGARGIHQGRRR